MNDDFTLEPELQDDPDDFADLGPDLPLLFEAAAVAGRYERGVLPGNDPIEILTGLYLGLTEAQLDAVEADQRLRDLIRRHWDAEGVDETLWQLADRDDRLGRRHAALLAGCGYHRLTADLDAEVEELLWLVLAGAPQAVATKGDEVADTTRWTFRSEPLRCLVAVTQHEGDYVVSFTPEQGVPGTGRVLARWSDGTVDAVDATFAEKQLVRVHFAASGRTLNAIAIALPGDDGA
nr:hypothetical protein [Propionibacterium sp.]